MLKKTLSTISICLYLVFLALTSTSLFIFLLMAISS